MRLQRTQPNEDRHVALVPCALAAGNEANSDKTTATVSMKELRKMDARVKEGGGTVRLTCITRINTKMARSARGADTRCMVFAGLRVSHAVLRSDLAFLACFSPRCDDYVRTLRARITGVDACFIL